MSQAITLTGATLTLAEILAVARDDRAVRLEGRSGQDLQPQRRCLGAGFAHQSRFAYAGLARDEQGRALTGVRIAQKPLQCLERRRPPDHHRAA